MAKFIKVWREGEYYIAEIPSLNIVDQGSSVSDLKNNLKEAIELTVESMVKDDLKLKGKKARDAIALLVKPLLASLDFVQIKGKPTLAVARA